MLDIILLNNIAPSVEIDLSICNLDEGDLLAPPGMPWYDSPPQCVTRLEFDLGEHHLYECGCRQWGDGVEVAVYIQPQFSERWMRDGGANRHSAQYQRSFGEWAEGLGIADSEYYTVLVEESEG